MERVDQGSGGLAAEPVAGAMGAAAVPQTVAGAAEAEGRDAGVGPDRRLAPGTPTRTFRLAQVVSVEVELPDQYPVVVLEDAEEHRWRLRFRIGIAEGVALAHVLQGTRAPRPLTPELFSTVLERFGIEVLAMRLTARKGSTYTAELDLIGASGHEVVPCRPSDGLCVALAQRLPAPVLVDELLFTERGDVEPGPQRGADGPAAAAR